MPLTSEDSSAKLKRRRSFAVDIEFKHLPVLQPILARGAETGYRI